VELRYSWHRWYKSAAAEGQWRHEHLGDFAVGLLQHRRLTALVHHIRDKAQRAACTYACCSH
jgi:hypothetical protein